MPRKRRIGILRTPTDYRGVGGFERLAWTWHGPYIYGDVVDAHGRPQSPGDDRSELHCYRRTVWPDWATWAETYGRCREDFLADRREGQPTPIAEVLYAAYLAGVDPGSVELPTEPDPRPVLTDPTYAARYDGLRDRYVGDLSALAEHYFGRELAPYYPPLVHALSAEAPR